jgi:hypothetical protein
MPDNDDGNEDGIYRADTVPPPDGDDAYNAPTRVGPMAATVVNEMIVAAQAQQSAERASASKAKVRGEGAVDGGELDDRDIEAELDPTAFPSRVPSRQSANPPKADAAKGLPSLRPPPVPVFPSRPPRQEPVASVAPPPTSLAPPPSKPVAPPASPQLPTIFVLGGVAALLLVLAFGYGVFALFFRR